MANQTTATEPIQLAQILSDLNSLRACVCCYPFPPTNLAILSANPTNPYTQDPSAALALVSARPNTNTTASSAPASTPESTQDTELDRAKDLLKLHYEVKEAHMRGELGRGLQEAREAVRRSMGG
ncbi:hypothetical protein PTNB73_10241 [Pyrenophora teres f. teres]|uniref:Uncharacterized protein n=1 Tax=Pyrenophora teres f. teres TaxID=97479 RepID=A0A6S6VQH4_9PLEO|nr:hypothetical protein HRS9139_09952 [Pyrenophora teres f. teres]KAE8826259.1 hypothetical protein PTNB85_09204 [Pyrenophora teres f. teres]KAE8832729.1 hypothetical protein HRS9122_08442 [Pyrenophora teres f. teres]KAE8852682.1 hypothetical protein PTNB29_10072 [Pyrenophora teres f. teres]KAE8854811.1 hypothetical protein PTNB73_10241 [Pyrenophora teres f. teres]